MGRHSAGHQRHRPRASRAPPRGGLRCAAGRDGPGRSRRRRRARLPHPAGALQRPGGSARGVGPGSRAHRGPGPARHDPDRRVERADVVRHPHRERRSGRGRARRGRRGPAAHGGRPAEAGAAGRGRPRRRGWSPAC